MVIKTNYYIPVFDEKRTVRVYLPVTYRKTNDTFPVLYMHDGQNVFVDDEAVGGRSLRLESYLKKNDTELIVVAIDSGLKRMEEYLLWPTGELSEELTGKNELSDAKGRKYIDFIVENLKPYIDETYRTKRECTYMAGISLGGLLTTYALCRYPTVFSKGAGISSAFFRNQEELERFIIESDCSGIKLYLDSGDTETGDEYNDRAFLDSNKQIFQLLEEKQGCIKFEVIEKGKHNYEAFSARVDKMMTFLVGD
ncbi:alpha/beta hydrolase [Guptibacillus hwajinpoensis]|uniref:Alpha/beta superfamily hydrolase n=1 Tax=Guptibacillus hwajinpoensis TaxID=208199 RepID=A0ABU0K5D4_9BACL|nr:alpha/beta hydrolase-fold protein [Alkalihalobacillus hemicentroti]MDQ0484560.1 putative alpha/beta superfamily hydrolase [Alkalihalobacillus hemicentroti]